MILIAVTSTGQLTATLTLPEDSRQMTTDNKNTELTTEKTAALSTVPQFAGMSLTRPEGPLSRLGIESITKDDLVVARLALAQALSPEVTEGDPRWVKGMTAGDLFNSATRENYGREVYVQIVRKDKLRAMIFNAIEDGGGVLEPNVSLRDPRTKWGKDGSKPEATIFRDYLAVILHPGGEKPIMDRIIALSFKSSGIKVAKYLNNLIVLRVADIFAGVYKITTDTDLVPKPHKVYKVSNAGWATGDTLKEGRLLYEAVKDLDVDIQRDASDDDIETAAQHTHIDPDDM
jgi:hypothetical protein